MKDFILQLGLKFSDDEKQECISTAHRIVNLSELAKEFGVLYLEHEVINDNNYIKLGVNLIVHGVGTEAIETIFQYSILSAGCRGADLLNKLIISQGLISISQGYDSYVVGHIIGAMLGDKYLSDILDKRKNNVELNFNNIIDKYTTPMIESVTFEEKLLKLKRGDLVNILIFVEDKTIAMALKGCSKAFISHIKNAVSENIFKEICLLLQCLALSKEQILEHQNIILASLDEPKSTGILT